VIAGAFVFLDARKPACVRRLSQQQPRRENYFLFLAVRRFAAFFAGRRFVAFLAVFRPFFAPLRAFFAAAMVKSPILEVDHSTDPPVDRRASDRKPKPSTAAASGSAEPDEALHRRLTARGGDVSRFDCNQDCLIRTTTGYEKRHTP
jgi:hypothetical protein